MVGRSPGIAAGRAALKKIFFFDFGERRVPIVIVPQKGFGNNDRLVVEKASRSRRKCELGFAHARVH